MANSAGAAEKAIHHCPLCIASADPDDAIGHSLGSHPISRKPLQTALCARRWKLYPCGHFTCCPQAATMACANCNLVQYCSLQCMQQHSESHRQLCESHLLEKETSPVRRKADPELLPWTPQKRFSHLPTLSSPSLPVHGLLGSSADVHYERLMYRLSASGDELASRMLPRPFACTELPDQLRFLFPCAYNLCNLLQTVCEVPENCSSRVTIFINSAKSILAVRDVLILELLRAYGSDGIDIAVGLWYSTALTPEQDKAVRLAIRRILYFGNTPESGNSEENLKPCRYKSSFPFSKKGSFMRADLSCDSTGILLGMLKEINAMFEPSNQYWERDEELHDIRNVKQMCALPAHLASWNRYHTCGILLPFDTMDDHFTIPNRVRYSSSSNYISRYSNDALCGWDIVKIISTGVKHGASDQDIYGCFFFHMREIMQIFLQKLKDCCIELYLTRLSAKKLADVFLQADLRFHRIDACSLADDGTVQSTGMPKICALSKKFSLPDTAKVYLKWTLLETLRNLGRLLEKDACREFPSRLLTAVMEWAITEPSAVNFLRRSEDRIKIWQKGLRKSYDYHYGRVPGSWSALYSLKIIPPHNKDILNLVEPFVEARVLMNNATVAGLRKKQFGPYMERLVSMELLRGLGLRPKVPNLVLPQNWKALMIWRSALEAATAHTSGNEHQPIIESLKKGEHSACQLYYTALFSGLTFVEEFVEWGFAHADSILTGSSMESSNWFELDK